MDSELIMLNDLLGRFRMVRKSHAIHSFACTLALWMSLSVHGAVTQKSVLSFGATGNGVNDDTAAVQRGLNFIQNNGGELYFPSGTYLISSSLTVVSNLNYFSLVGEGYGGSTLKARFTGTGSQPLLKMTSRGTGYSIRGLHFLGNNLTGASGNGHALALINTASNPGVDTFWPQTVVVENCSIEGFRGVGLDVSGGQMPACGIYNFGSLNVSVSHVTTYQCAIGVKGVQCFTFKVDHLVGSEFDYNGIFLEGAVQSAITGCDLAGAGAAAHANTTDGVITIRNCEAISIDGGYAKNGWPYVINGTGTDSVNKSLTVSKMRLSQLDSTRANTVMGFGTGNQGLTISGNLVTELYSWTNAVGILFLQGPSGYSLTSPQIVGNQFIGGEGSRYHACIWIDVENNFCLSPAIKGNVFGQLGAAGVPTYIDDCIRLENKCTSPLISGNTAVAGNNIFIDNFVNVVSSDVTGLVWEQNNAFAPFGTTGVITNALPNTESIVRLQDGVLTLGNLGGTAGFTRSYSGTLTTGLVIDRGQGVNFDVPVNGARVGDLAWGSINKLMGPGVSVSAYVSGDNHINVTLINLTTNTISSANNIITATAFRVQGMAGASGFSPSGGTDWHLLVAGPGSNDYSTPGNITAGSITSGSSLVGASVALITTNAFAVPTSQSGITYNNNGALSEIAASLPTAATNLIYRFVVRNAVGWKIQATGGATIRASGYISGVNGYLESITLGDIVDIFAISDHEWYAAIHGTGWNIDGSNVPLLYSVGTLDVNFLRLSNLSANTTLGVNSTNTVYSIPGISSTLKPVIQGGTTNLLVWQGGVLISNIANYHD